MGRSTATRISVRLRPVPTYDPPYDDERPPDWRGTVTAPPLFEIPPAGPSRSSTGRPPATAAASRAGTAPPPTTAAAVRFVNTCLEIFNGYRSVAHFRALADPLAAGAVVSAMTDALRQLRRAAHPLPAGRRSLVKLRQMRTCEPRPGAAEVAVVVGVRTGPRTGEERCWALAFRLEQQRGRWLCTSARLL